MYIVQTVSAGPRAWPVAAQGSQNMETSCTQDNQRRDDQPGSVRLTPPVSRRRTSQVGEERDTDRKRKWTLGGLFRRKKKEAVESESSSQEDENPPKKGFLARRKSRRERKKQKAIKAVATFDHIVVNPLTQKPKSSPSGTTQEMEVMAKEASRAHKDSRDSQGGSVDRMSSRNSSGGSGSVEGSVRRVKRGFMTRVEARRDRQRGDSSSEEGDCYVNHSVGLPRFKSDDSIAGVHREGSFSRRSRGARTERYIKRMSRDEEGILKKEVEADLMQRQRMCKSDAEGSFGRKVGPRWSQAHEVNDQEPRPHLNPNFVQKNSANQYLTSSLDRKTQQSNLRVTGPHSRIPSPISSSKSSESVSKVRLDLPRCRLGITSIEPLCKSAAPEFPITGQRSISYDSNIHRTLSSPPVQSQGEVMVVQFPVARLSSIQNRYIDFSSNVKGPGTENQSSFVGFKQPPPPPPPRDPQRKIYPPSSVVSQQEATRPISFAFENKIHHTVRQPVSDNNSRALQNTEAPSVSFNSPVHQQICEGNIGVPRVNSQRRSVSDEQITPPQPQVSHPFLSVRARPSSVTPEAMKSSIQKSPVLKRYITRNPEFQTHPRYQTPGSPSFQYFADQHPRSRKPIHIQYSNTNHEQPYLSDSQVMMKPPHPVTEFWRARDQEGLPRQRKIHCASPKPPLQPGARSDRSRSNSPRPDHAVSPETTRAKSQKFKIPPLTFPVRLGDSQSSLSAQSDVSNSLPPTSSKLHLELLPHETCDSTGVQNGDSLRRKESFRPLSMVLENSESHEQSSQRELKEDTIKSTVSTQPRLSLKREPPAPPARRSARLSSTSSQDASDWMSEDGCEGRKKRRSTNLDDALTELEAIYKSLRLGDEDLLDRAERRDLPTAHQQFKDDPCNNSLTVSHSYRGAESDSGFNYGWGSSTESLHGSDHMQKRTRAPALRRSGIPDRVGDDMAYRRLHPKEKQGTQDARNIVSQAGSYLLVSPALSQGTGSESSLPGLDAKIAANKLQQEPDITYDDMLFRNMRQANNTLKVLDPQPPFGIPLGPITTASNSDYLHAVPGDKYRPTFKPRKSPDVVKDDLAFRNLRKDDQKDPVLPVDDLNNFLNSLNTSAHQKRDSNFSLRKKRAVRSLSANLQSIVKREALSLPVNAMSDIDIEKAQSLSDLPDALQVAQKILEGKVVIGGGSAKLRERTANTSTETLTDSRANLVDGAGRRTSWQQKLRVFIPPPLPQESSLQRPPPPITPERKSSLLNVDLSKLHGQKATATPSVHSSVAAVSDTVPGSPIDEGHLEEMLSALAREAKATSEKLGKELKELADETSNIPILKASILGSVGKSNKETQTPESLTSLPAFTVSEKLPDSLPESVERLGTSSLLDKPAMVIPLKHEPDVEDEVQHSSLAKLLHEEHMQHRKQMLLELELQQSEQKPEKSGDVSSLESTTSSASPDKTFNNNWGEVVKGEIANEETAPMAPCRVGEGKCEEAMATTFGGQPNAASPGVPDGVPLEPPQGGDEEMVEAADSPGEPSERRPEPATTKAEETNTDADADASPPTRPGGSGGRWESGASEGGGICALTGCQQDMSERRACLPVRSATVAVAAAAEPSDGGGSRAERMARYKEERRRQLAEQFGARPDDSGAGAASSTTTTTPARRYITRAGEPGVRTTRTSRLRAAGAAASGTTTTTTTTTTPTTSDSGKDSSLGARTSPRHKDPSSSTTATAAAPRSPVSREAPSLRLSGGTEASPRTRKVGVVESTVARRRGTATATTTTSTPSSSSDHEPSPAAPSDSAAKTADRREKDKSSKRKSNLNRSLTEEVVVDDVADEHTTRRRRRRVDVPAECLEPLTPLAGRRATAARTSPRTSPASPTGRSPELPAAPPPPPPPPGPAAVDRRPRTRPSPETDARPLRARSTSHCGDGSPATTPSPSRVARSPDNQEKTANCVQSIGNCSNVLSIPKERVQDPMSVEFNGLNSGYDSAFVIQNVSGSKSSSRKQVLVKECDVGSHEPQVSSLPSTLQHTPSYRTRETSRSLSGSPVRHPSSILKKKSLDETHSKSDSPVRPVSILKRKPSRDSSSVSPVTFSPTVVDPASRHRKKQGILKKRASLDECEVMRRSCSPDLGSEPHDFKPILKHHRRSSLEELGRRTQSPDPQPQSILKRRTSREDELDDSSSASPEPQGILKRKSASSNSSNGSSASNSPHVSISSSVLLAARVDAADNSDSAEQVKPILKKKSSSEDSASTECFSEVPKPILKKKHSVDVEEFDDKPMKPILKTSRKSSQEERDSDLPARHMLLRGRSLGSESVSESDCEVKPILKQPYSEGQQQRERSVSPRHKLSFSDYKEASSLDSSNASGSGVKRRPRPASIIGMVRCSSSAIDNELSMVLNRRRSLQVENVAAQDLEHEDPPKSSHPDDNDPHPPEMVELPHLTSVAQKILTMEGFLSDESVKGSSLLQPSTGAVPKKPFFHRLAKSKDRFYTQPITLEEIQASARLESVQVLQKGVQETKLPEDDRLSDLPFVCDASSRLLPKLERAPSPEVSCEQEQLVPRSCKPMEEELGNATEGGPEGTDLKRSDSVVAVRASLFAQLEEQMKVAADEAKSRRAPRAGLRHRERNVEGASRYATQPVTCDELQEAVRHNQRSSGASCSTADLHGAADDQEGRDDDDPSKLTLAERVKLFNQKIKEETLPKAVDGPLQRPLARKRVVSSRFKTQPVTTDEVDNAQRISTLAATLTKPPDVELLGSLSAKAVKEKIYEHASKILSKQQDSNQKIKSASVAGDEKPKGILKNAREGDAKKPSQNDSVAVNGDSSEEEFGSDVKSILKTSTVASGSPTVELDSFRHLKSVLKRETSDTDQHCEVVSATNEHLRSILKQESKDWSTGDGSSMSSSDNSILSEEEEVNENISQVSKTVHLRGGKNMDLVSILHDVEATARQQRQASNKNGLESEESIMNQKNLSHERETKTVRHSYQKARVAEISSKTISESYNSKKIILNHQELKSSVHRKVEARHMEDSKSLQKLVESPQGVKLVSSTKQCKSYEHRHHQQLDIVSSQNDTTPPTSDGDTTSSSGGREVRQIISNEASARRKPPVNKYHKARSSLPAQTELSKSKSHSAVATSITRNSLQVTSRNQSNRHSDVENHVSENFTGFVRDGIRRSFTQPMTNLEQKEAGESKETNRTSIADRVAALQKSKEQDWKKRVPKTNPDEELICTVNNHLNAFPTEKDDVVGGGSILADRKGKLDAAKQGWKKRVEPTDAVQFSVAGKMKLENKTANEPLYLPQQNGERKHRMPQRSRFRSKMAELKDISSTPSSPQKEITPVLKRSNSAPGGDDDASSDQETVLNGSKVAVPRADDETFTAFFRSLSSEQPERDQLEINDDDLDLVISKSSQLSVQKRTVKVQRRHVASRNPIKALASRVDIQEEYVEMRTGVAEKELRRLNMEKLAKNSSFAVEALAGLASKEDFTSVALKKALPNSSAMLPYRELMLLQVKGRRHVQTRLVEPSPSSINSGDSYVLITPTDVFHWVGTYANVIERSRGAEVALHVQQKRDLGFCGTGSVITIYEEKVGSYSSSAAKKFWRLLGGNENSRAVEAGHPDEDELYESSIIDTNVVYEVEDDELVPVDSYIGSIPKIEMLDPSKILVFDFGSELYVWNGKTAPLERRRVAQSLVRELWAEGFNYLECDVCPVTVAQTLGCRLEIPDSSLLAGSLRPEWALLAKVTQHMETILFREKFLDWPDFTRVIRSKDYEDTDKQVDASIDISPCDAKKMLEENCNYPDLVLEGSHLARGDTYFDEETHRHFEISTHGVTMWHIMEFESAQLPASSLGQFHSADSYVVRWTYSITVTGRELNGQPSRHSMAGRDRCAYFCWQGSEASLNEQGAAALLTVELDHERGPQVRVVQGAEPPAFLRLFQGAMIVHSGLRESEHMNHRKGWRLYVCRGEHRQEAALVQVTCSVRSLRSRASFILVKTATGTVYVWHGAKTRPHTQKTAIYAAEHLKKKPLEMEFPLEAEITITVQNEGSESRDFFAALGGSNRQLYVSLQKENHAYDYTPRLFHLSSISGTFSATEVLSLLRDGDTVVAYPFLQTDLYSASQPALFLLDNHHELWLWQGWWPDCGEENSLENSFVRGSRAVLWQVERRAAMQTALDYWQLKHGSATPRAYLVWAGLEPLHFTNLFPTWTDRDDVAELNISDGRKPGELLTVEGELARLTCSTYPAAQLLQRPLPDGVDPTRLELYLDPSHFQELLGMTKEEFFELPTWKQTNLKKEVGLF